MQVRTVKQEMLLAQRSCYETPAKRIEKKGTAMKQGRRKNSLWTG